MEGLTKKAAVLLWPSHALLPISGRGTPFLVRHPSQSMKTDKSSLLSHKEIRSLRVLRCYVLFLAGSEQGQHIFQLPFPHGFPEPPLPPEALAADISGRDQTNFLPNIHKQNKTCAKQGNASSCAITITCHLKSSSLSGIVWGQILRLMYKKRRIPTGEKLPNSTKGTELEG